MKYERLVAEIDLISGINGILNNVLNSIWIEDIVRLYKLDIQNISLENKPHRYID